ncbi:hypothetical protein LAZ67_3003849 [Cordylochernes scorpioides]|uniref:Gag-Pol-p199 n=1 Tax=Cordylochernes scorpioides TaxID=51811 RepID=A0ABY6KDJ3_9ARAC|nr:hypothetical protein LAZ67_3003849 [Cordylochernes scorpioides]
MTKRIHEVRSVKFSEDKRGIDYANDIQEDTNCDNLTYKGNCEEIVAEDFLILKEDNPVTESKMKSQEDTSVKLGGDCENDSSQTEPIQERCVKGGRKKGETKSILEERHKARLEEQERKLIEEGVRRSQRIKDRNNTNLIMEIDHYIPENFKEAMDSGERNEWHKATEDELSEIEKHKVWTLVPRENGMKVINSKWVYSTKKTPSDGIYKRKARLVAVGCNQRYGVDYKESFSPVLKKESLRTIVALATQQNLTIKTYDVKTAYLYGKCWNKKINEILYQLGMIRTKCDPCVYKLQRGEEYAILGLYVDDLIIAGTSKEINDNLASEIEKYVTLTEKKDSEPFIGIEIKREEDGFYLSQTHYIDTILHRFGLEECNSVQRPGDQNQNLDEYLDSKPVDKTVYQEMIGSLMYLSTGTRPDISFNVSNLSQYNWKIAGGYDQTKKPTNLLLIRGNGEGKIRDFMLTSDVTEEELEQDDEEALQYTQRYKRIYKKCLALVEPRIPASSPTTSEVSFASSSHHRTVKLPKIELKKFTGEIKDWLGWWAQFNKIHVDSTLEDSDKFQYLVQSMSPGTRASKLVDSYPLTAENYPKVIETLTERFGRPELLQQVYVRDLIRLMIDCSSKQQLKVTSFYDELVTHLRALESLKIEARQMSVFIFPMIEACLSEELMKAWQRSPLHDVKIDANDSTQTRVDLIMEFLQKEAAAEQDRALAGSKFGLRSLKQDRNVGRQSHPAKIPTASGLFAGRAQNCIFCNKDHKNTECLAARRMSIKERRERIKNAKCCFSCLQPGHISFNCRRRITECIRCKKKHLDILCPLNAPGRESADEDKEQVKDCDASPTVENGVSFSGLSASSLILLQTLKIKVEGATSTKVVRALLDTGSQRSYILSKTAQDLGLSPIGQESLKHVVFGGHTSERVHQEYRVNLGHASGNFKMVAKLLDQQKICGSLPRLSRGPWLKELKARKIWVPDIGKDDMEIEILLGCDVLGSIFMMKSCVLSNGLTASQTRFGWTLMGECQPGSDVSLAHHVTTMTISESSITNLWNLDVLGIMDPIEVKQRDQRDALARRHFLKTVQHSVSGRYVVSLPWTVEKAKIANNREVAMKRLEQTTKKLISLNLYEDYDDIFRGWLDDGIIEKVPAEQHDAEAFYLPHRPVVKLSSGTTPIRPVFDASSKVYRSPSLNDCLEKGPNLIEMIPNLMLRFRNGKFGVVADIKKAFLQIEVNERDRDYLRFLWYSQNREKTEVFRHRRVVFGVNCSPFILGAVIEYHLSNVRPEHKPLAQRLQKSFYVDNLVTSVNSFEELQDLKLTATSIMDNARLELSRWEHSLDVASDTYPFERAEISKVLGVCWDKRDDCLSCEIPVAIPPKITKRSILSCLAQIYDPIGFLSPILIKPKILLQKAWTLKLAWDDELDRHYKDELSLWFDDLQLHKGMAIPRNFNPLMVPQKDWQIHTFVDASSEAYAAVVFLRTRVGDKVEVHMMAAKSRVAPLKRPTIPRLELLACVVGARLNKMIFEALKLKDIKNVFWSDATTALTWIKRDDQWGTFVGNRVKEICRLSDPGNWRYVPSECNPADLPSRGCSLSRLIQSRWWEGPSWLKLSEEFWPSRYKDLNEEEICAERKKIAVVTTVKSTDHWYMKYFSSFIKNVRMMAWIRRFINNLRSSTKVKGELSVKEIDEAELALLKLVQAECFPSHSIPGLKVSEVEGILRVKTKLIYSSDEYGFRLPVLLHGTHPLIEQMICDSHVENCHAGVQFLMNKLREKYWIVKARQTIKKIVRRCVTCRRFSAKPVVVEDAPLPATRVHNAKVFEVVGIDLAGPLYLKDQTKTWVVLFTCAVYRCVHLELVISLSTEDFLMALERFIKRRGRPSTIFSDNGTNFVGANNFFKKIDWERVSNDGKVKRIEWKFIPPTAAWWGGWWERLIRSLKDILKRMLGTSTLTYQQLMTLLCHAEAVMNGRPMTYVSDDPNDLVTISPSMFLQEQTDVEFPECQNMGSNPTTQKLRYLSKLREELKSRFRKEYLSLLVQRNRRIYNPKLQAGDVVLVGMDNKKRNFWPLAVIEEILFGRDGVNRLVKVKTAVGTFLRPIQKIYPLEISTATSSRLLNDKVKTAKIQTRSGRTICKPNRLDDYLCFSVCLDKNRWECVWNGGDPLFRTKPRQPRQLKCRL